MKLRVIAITIVSFIVSLTLFLPYKHIYSYYLSKVIREKHIPISFSIKKASPLSVYFESIAIDKTPITLKDISIKVNPLFFLQSKLLTIKTKKAQMNIQKNGEYILLTGYINSTLIRQMVDSPLKEFLNGLDKNNLFVIKIKPQKDRLLIEKLTCSGDFSINAGGFIRNGNLRLDGTIKIGKFKQRFRINERF